jgi:uncharacterized protein (DUF3084 family)
MQAMMGLSVNTDTSTLESVRFLINAVNLLTDRKAVAEQLQELVDQMAKYNRVRAELEQREHNLVAREKSVQAVADGLDRKRRLADEREQALAHREQLLAQQQKAFDAVRAEARRKLDLAA